MESCKTRKMIWLGVLLAWLPVASCLDGKEPGTIVPIKSIDEIRKLSREEAAEALPAKLSGTCIYAANDEFFIHDGSCGIWVSGRNSKLRGLLREPSDLADLRIGMTVDVEGVTDPGTYARQILPTIIRQTGSGTLPKPLRISAEQLVAGSEDGQHVEIEGVIQDVQVLEDRTVCSLMSQGVNCLFALHGGSGRNLPPLVDAKVSVIGALAPDHNNRSEAVLPKIISSTDDCIRIIKPPPADPFESPRVSLDDLRGFSPDVTLFHRKVTSGVVTFVRPGEFFFLQEGGTSIKVSSDAVGLRPGFRVEVAGFIDISQHLAALKNGIVRRTGESPRPEARRVTARDILKSASWQAQPHHASSDLSGHNVTLHGIIRRIDRSSPMAPVAVWLETDNILFPANLPPETVLDEKQSDSWQPGAELELTGTCELIFRGRPDPLGLYDPVGFHLWLASPNDVRITRTTPWWTTRRLSIALLGTGIAALIAFGFVAVLRRQVKLQVRVIGRELETNAIASERERMARDLHDTLEQQLTGVAMQLESLAKSPQAQVPDFRNRLTLATKMLHHSREEARRSVWDLRNRILENHGFAAAVESLAASAAIDGGPVVSTRISGSRAHLPSAVTYQLLRMVQEALANALKHACASEIVISLEMSADQYVLSIRDDGCGFDAGLDHLPGPPHFGLIGMRERASRIGAEIAVVSQTGQGCTVHIRLPLRSS